MSKVKRIISIGFTFILMLCMSVYFVGCKQANDFSEQEHIERVTERINNTFDKWSYADENQYNGYKLYPLYDQNENLKYFLIELQPYDFCFVQIKDEGLGVSCSGSKSMYRLSTKYGTRGCSPYRIDETGKQVYEIDEQGNRVVYKNSPYFISTNNEDRKYLFPTSTGYICSPEQNGKKPLK